VALAERRNYSPSDELSKNLVKCGEVDMASETLSERFPLDAGCCQIRPYREADKATLVRIANNWQIAKNMRNLFPHPYTAADADAWLKVLEMRNPLTNFAVTVSDELVGGLGLSLGSDVHFRTAELGYWLGEDFWGRGIATAAVRAFTRYGFDAFDLLRIFAGVFSWNPASMRVLEKAGYVREGVLRKSVVKDGHVLDQAVYAMTGDIATAALPS
jgi:RimJ/RimL family protein N-acetyltransferase